MTTIWAWSPAQRSLSRNDEEERNNHERNKTASVAQIAATWAIANGTLPIIGVT